MFIGMHIERRNRVYKKIREVFFSRNIYSWNCYRGDRNIFSSIMTATTELILVRNLERILTEREFRRALTPKLKSSCQKARDMLKERLKQTKLSQSSVEVVECEFVEIIFEPFELSCQSKHTKLIEIGLDCIQKLIMYGLVSGEVGIGNGGMDRRRSSLRQRMELDGLELEDDKNDNLLRRCIHVVCDAFQGVQTDENVQLQIIKALLTLMTSRYCSVHDKYILMIVRTVFHIYLVVKSITYKKTSQGALLQMITGIFTKMETEENARIEISTNQYRELMNDPEMTNIEDQIFHDVIQQTINTICTNIESSNPNHTMTIPLHVLDAYYVFQTLCALSMKSDVIDSSVDEQTYNNNSKTLALRLLLAILQHAGPVFKSYDVFIKEIRMTLCVGLVQNGVSMNIEIFELSLAVFVELLNGFKQQLKMQIEVFFRDILLNILESNASSFTHKLICITILSKICSDAQCVVDFYVNYDCDMNTSNIFERLTLILAKIAQGRQAIELGTTEKHQEKLFRVKGLESLVSILQCLVEWSKELYIQSGAKEQKIDNDSNSTINNNNHNNNSSSSNQLNGYDENQLRSHSSTDNLPLSNYEAIKKRKNMMEEGIDLFNTKPKKGMKFLQDKGFVDDSSKRVAVFLANEERLDKTAIGDYLGENDQYCKEVMYGFIDNLDFSGMNIVPALRFFLNLFRLPGEAQKIDRLMEKFAARYCRCNPNNGIFASANAAYVLAYSIIILTTDLHSENVKKKISKEDYIKMNRGINDNDDLPEEFLSDVYDQIANEEIKTTYKQTTTIKTKQDVLVNQKQRSQLYHSEMEQIMLSAYSLMEHVSNYAADFQSAHHIEHVRPMFLICWSPFLAAFSVGLQDCDDERITKLCLDGIRCAIRIGCIFDLRVESNAYIRLLARFTLLPPQSTILDMAQKNIDCIKTLIRIAHTDGNYLSDSWHDILACVSKLELAQTLSTIANDTSPFNGSGHVYPTPSDITSSTNSQQSSTNTLMNSQSNSTLNNGNNTTSITSIPITSLFAGVMSPAKESIGTLYNLQTDLAKFDAKKRAAIHEQFSETRSQSVVVAVDRIFTGSVYLVGSAIVDFVTALCDLSLEELDEKPPRMFCLQKIVEISYYNMGRIRLQWTRIWQIIGKHFNVAGCSRQDRVATFAIDSLRQLSLKFLEKGEFANFNFQKDFLRPFEHIIKTNGSSSIRDMVVCCVSQLVAAESKNIRSGWKNIFSVLHFAASISDVNITMRAFHIVEDIVNIVLKEQPEVLIDSFQDMIKCLAEFACCLPSSDVPINALRLIKNCSDFVAENNEIFIDTIDGDDDNGEKKEDAWIKGWLPIFFELSCIINRSHYHIQTNALHALFVIIRRDGERFTEKWWMDLFNVICRVFDDTRLPLNPVDRQQWLQLTSSHALYQLTDTFIHFHKHVHSFMLPPLYNKIIWCISKENEHLIRAAIECLQNIIIKNGSIFTFNDWANTTKCFASIFVETSPKELLKWKMKEKRKISHRQSFNEEKNNQTSSDTISSDIATTQIPSTSSSSLSSSSSSFQKSMDTITATESSSSTLLSTAQIPTSTNIDGKLSGGTEESYNSVNSSSASSMLKTVFSRFTTSQRSSLKKMRDSSVNSHITIPPSSNSETYSSFMSPMICSSENGDDDVVYHDNYYKYLMNLEDENIDDQHLIDRVNDINRLLAQIARSRRRCSNSSEHWNFSSSKRQYRAGRISNKNVISIINRSTIYLLNRDDIRLSKWSRHFLQPGPLDYYVQQRINFRNIVRCESNFINKQLINVMNVSKMSGDQNRDETKVAEKMHSLLMKCFIQSELIQTVEAILFSNDTARREIAGMATYTDVLINSGTAAAGKIPPPILFQVNSEDDSVNCRYFNLDEMEHFDKRPPSNDDYLKNYDEGGRHPLLHKLKEYLVNDDDLDGNTLTSLNGVFSYIRYEHLNVFVDCLLNLHQFARLFNANHDQRILLGKAGFGKTSKPSLLSQETQSLLCAIRLLFRMFSDERFSKFWKDIQQKLLDIIVKHLIYYIRIKSTSHRKTLFPVITTILFKILTMNNCAFFRFINDLYPYFVEITTIGDTESEIKCLVREYLLRCAYVSRLSSTSKLIVNENLHHLAQELNE
ncbi:hypothetical protein SNEBB_010468 [Seison nebaliae]|nr:hypothetical protein SNEBB_010468 [Seison nebaliae]